MFFLHYVLLYVNFYLCTLFHFSVLYIIIECLVSIIHAKDYLAKGKRSLQVIFIYHQYIDMSIHNNYFTTNPNVYMFKIVSIFIYEDLNFNLSRPIILIYLFSYCNQYVY